MFVHSVFFWLKEDLNEEERANFKKGVESLLDCEGVVTGYIGTPAATTRPVVDSSYDISIAVVMADLAGHDKYQEDPIHLEFINTFKDYWTKVQIYDAD